ncbi:isocitrate lyase/PEP mutase family protein [Caenimonas soli]|uniref:isocitrate lyase/PEP mutase family protein n=1 Tax=Caenimonas soli TaxID=2735555 RepID=UPI00155589DC|nr:isocitrate lyase/phosphoenolpyruvate mutase family protein [Caenimonas soli]NPC58455.1 isocitrate lyase/phosphoenolpyruvate mutase family protein [Caenimonas soli]
MSSSHSEESRRRRAFRELHRAGCFVMPSPWDRGSAKYLEGLGFKALGTSSGGAAWSSGQAEGSLPMDRVLSHAQEIIEATSLPVNVSFEAGFARSAEDLARNVFAAANTGAAGIGIEDGTGDNANPVWDIETASARLGVTRATLDALGPDAPLLVGRAENFWAGRADLADTIKRLQAYAAAGADVLYAPGVTSRDGISAIVNDVHPKPVNVLVSSDIGLTLKDLAALGVRRISVGGALARSAWGGFMRAARSIAEDGRFDFDHPAIGKELDSLFTYSTRTPSAVNATVAGRVEFRLGEGPLVIIPAGPVEIILSAADVVFGWTEGSSRQEAAIPFVNFCRYVATGDLILQT